MSYEQGAPDAAFPHAPTHDPLILLPGFLSDARIWGPQIEALSADHTLFLPSLTRGDSIEEMAQAVLANAPPSFAVAGPSLGALVAMEMLRRAPDRVKRIAMISTNCLAETPPASAERETRIARVKGGRLAEVVAEEVPADALAAGEVRQPLAEFLAEMAIALGAEVYQRQARAMQRRPDQQRTLRQAHIPALVLCGGQDTLTLPRRHEFLAGLMPRAELVQVEAAGHVPTLEAPAEVTTALRGWLARESEALLLK